MKAETVPEAAAEPTQSFALALSSQSALAHVAHLSNALAYRAGFGGGDAAGGEIAAGVLEFLKMDAAELDPLQAEMTEAIGGLEAALPGA